MPEAHCQMCAHKRAEKETAACGDASSLSRQRWPTIPHIMLCRISNAPHTSITAQNANITWHWSFSLYFKRLCYHAPNWNECCCSVSTQIHSGYSTGVFRGFISCPDEELCMDHLRSGSGQAKALIARWMERIRMWRRKCHVDTQTFRRVWLSPQSVGAED